MLIYPGAEAGFGNEAPFDEFLAMSEPPATGFGVDDSFGYVTNSLILISILYTLSTERMPKLTTSLVVSDSR